MESAIVPGIYDPSLADRVLLTGNVPMTKPPAVLIDRAQEIPRLLGYTDAAVDWAAGFGAASDFLRFAQRSDDAAAMQLD